MNKRRGRPSGPSDTRERIVASAGRLFAEQGYAKTSLRAIGRDADVDHALVSYYFGNKEGLFRAVVDVALSPRQVLDAVIASSPPEQLGPRLVAAAVELWERAEYQGPLVQLVGESVAASGHAVFREYLETEIFEALREVITPVVGPARARRNAAAASSVLAGLFFTRYLLRLELVVAMSPAEVVRVHGSLLQIALWR